MFDKERLRYAMNISNLSQAKLAKKTGLSRVTIFNYLGGKFNPTEGNVILLAKALGVNKDWLLGENCKTFFTENYECDETEGPKDTKKKEINQLILNLEDIAEYDIYRIRTHLSMLVNTYNLEYEILDLILKLNYNGKSHLKNILIDMFTKEEFLQKAMTVTATVIDEEDYYKCIVTFDKYSHVYYNLDEAYIIYIYERVYDESEMEDELRIKICLQVMPDIVKDKQEEFQDAIDTSFNIIWVREK